ncbi:phage antirepressor [Pseudomonas chlororaphis]|uniref:phage antirepressor n=1 Tax=Pseudomonas chlororaphis TaxID=587753 RepID=UPI001B30EB67|nr:phage antirepressor [Pseudomonas chlororaphis]MBP5054344.1 phage antirepressor [Pseudomonas chlororaphis]MBP5140282.1 phage antirepressor [Pseudomonas chlororaphis]QTT99521.1 phage antirepressor [Pseudomonas chlororaphis]
MTDLTITGGQTATMTSSELLDLVNQARAEFGEAPVRRNDFVARCEDELQGEHYETFVVQNLNKTESTELRMSRDHCTWVLMRESKAVRRRVTERLNRPMTAAEQLLASVQLTVDLERRQRQTEQLQVQQQVAIERVEQRVEDLSESRVWDHCPQNCQSLTRVKETMLKRHGLSGAVVDYVLRVWPNQPNPAGMVRNGHEEALGSQYLVWSKHHVTAAFHRFVSESTMVTATQATHPYFEGRFRLVQKVQP